MLAAALTILLSSFLLFLVQPIVAKQILPWFGGSAGVWTVCLMFFQVVLLLGYGYAHQLTQRIRGRGQFSIHIVLLLLSCAALPIVPSARWLPSEGAQPTIQILGLLTATVGLPYFLLAATGPLLQRWLSTAAAPLSQGRSIYRLFAVSNVGSLVGLLAYPFVIEPFTTVRVQAWTWSGGYVLFVICLVRYAWGRRRAPDVVPTGTADTSAIDTRPSLALRAYWISCAGLGSALLLAVTSQITQNVASIPLMWIVPLCIYLVSFVVCFEGRSGRGWYERKYWLAPTMVATGAMAWALFADGGVLSIFWAIPIFMVGLFFGCVLCHGELSRSKPSPAYLTLFYLCLAGGGALGGMLVALVAPLVFVNYWEMPLALILLALLGLYCCKDESQSAPLASWIQSIAIAVVGTTATLVLLGGLPAGLDNHTLEFQKIVKGDARYGCAALLFVTALSLQRIRLSRAVALAALLCAVIYTLDYYVQFSNKTELMVRNFYGTLRVSLDGYGPQHIRRLTHGVVVHGSQIVESPQSAEPTTYYGTSSGIGRTLLAERASGAPLRIGSIGLGAGTLAAYGKAGDEMRVYELNPAVLDIATNRFSYLSGTQAHVVPVLGDARLSLERELARGQFDDPKDRFDVLSVDAFSGDSVPTHLLTREAFALYARVVKPGGVVAFHVSNNYLDLAAVVRQVARDHGFDYLLIADRPVQMGLISPSDWVLATQGGAFLQRPEIAAFGTPIPERAGLGVWTDQFSNLFQILK